MRQVRGNKDGVSNGYKLLSPVSNAILWVMQSSIMEEYRVAALNAWECLTAPQENSIGRSGVQRHLVNRSRGFGVDNTDPIEAEVQRMNLSDDSAIVRRQALEILMSRKKFRSAIGLVEVRK